MASYTGMVRHNDLEGGFFELVTDGGDVFRLQGAGDLEAGKRVRVHGELDEGGFGIQMTGPAITVSKIERL